MNKIRVSDTTKPHDDDVGDPKAMHSEMSSTQARNPRSGLPHTLGSKKYRVVVVMVADQPKSCAFTGTARA